ncbi:MAG TPA: S8 family serine peptidase [Steroidobacteraceae bacterium]|nr:S8 family serine peptidase [Steroidobacteraceae bacterium]
MGARSTDLSGKRRLLVRQSVKRLLTLWRPRIAAVAGLALVTNACGDLGYVRMSPTSNPQGATGLSSGVATPPFNAQLALTNTYAAFAKGYTGNGVTIGVVDSGIMPNNPAVAGRVVQEIIDVDPTQNNTSIPDVVGHGTWVSQIAAGAPFGQFTGGIAPGASLVSARIIDDNAPDDNGYSAPTQVTTSDAQFLQSVIGQMISSNVQVMNNSWGGIAWDTSNTALNQAFDAAYASFVESHNGLVVFSAGNDSQANPSTIAALPTVAGDAALQQGWLVAVALNSNSPTQLDSYSNKCGIAMNYCLAAPGDVIVLDKDILASTTNPSYYIIEGTSFAAPQVSGAAALVWQAYPYFSNYLVAQTLLGTATPLGGSQPNPTFGYGVLNVGAAVNGPEQLNWGTVTVGFSGNSSWNNPISGAGGLTMSGPGTLYLTQPSTYTGQTQVQGGALGAVSLASPVIISSQGTLLIQQSIVGNVSNGGVLVLNGAGNVSVTGNYVQQAGRLAVSLGSALMVTGTATLSGGDLYVFGALTGYTMSSHTEVLNATGGLTGTFSALDTSPSVALTASIGYNADSAWLNVTQVNLTGIQGLPYSTASYTAAIRAQGAFEQIDSQLSGGAVQHLISASFIAGAANLQHSATTARLQQSLESLSGQLHGASAAMTLSAIDAGTQGLSDHFDELLDEAPEAMHLQGWSRDLRAYGALWHSGYSNVGYDLDGGMVGEDQRIGSRGVVGFALARSQFLGQLTGSADESNTAASEGMIYGGVIGGPWYAMGQVGFGRSLENMRRLLELNTIAVPVSSLSSGSYSVAYGESGYRLNLGALRLTPYANLQYARLWGDGFDELGADGFGLQAPGHTVGRWQAGAGLHADREWRFAAGTLSVHTRLLWQRAFAMRGVAFDASFAALQQWMPLTGIGPSRYGSLVGETVAWSFNPRSSLQLDYQQQSGQNDSVRTVSADFRWSF